MKKVLLTALLALGIAACSTENDTETNAILEQHSTARGTAATSSSTVSDPYTFPCWSPSTAHYDNVGSFGYPKWAFVADVPSDVQAGVPYKVVLEIQATDGEDITVGYGDILTYTDNVVYNNVTVVAPSVVRAPADLLQWYRWRLRIYNINTKNRITCEQVTQWYDNPLG